MDLSSFYAHMNSNLKILFFSFWSWRTRIWFTFLEYSVKFCFRTRCFDYINWTIPFYFAFSFRGDKNQLFFYQDLKLDFSSHLNFWFSNVGVLFFLQSLQSFPLYFRSTSKLEELELVLPFYVQYQHTHWMTDF